jgi:hypothetical protein
MLFAVNKSMILQPFRRQKKGYLLAEGLSTCKNGSRGPFQTFDKVRGLFFTSGEEVVFAF